LVGDAAGLADPHSGEGIRPAVESGLLAADALIATGGCYDRASLSPYADAIQRRFGSSSGDVTALLPARAKIALGRRLLGREWFARRVVVDRWFLHREQPPLSTSIASVARLGQEAASWFASSRTVAIGSTRGRRIRRQGDAAISGPSRRARRR
jgi:hypothetical protein